MATSDQIGRYQAAMEAEVPGTIGEMYEQQIRRIGGALAYVATELPTREDSTPKTAEQILAGTIGHEPLLDERTQDLLASGAEAYLDIVQGVTHE